MTRRRILKVFNRYLSFGGEEASAEKIHRLLREDHELINFPLDSAEWVGPAAPGVFRQAWRTIYNFDSRRRFERAVAKHRPDLVLMHNIYPVGSPSLYHAALRLNIPIIQYAHNYRPLCVGGTLYVNGHVIEEAVRGNYWREIIHGSWQQSVIKSAIFALTLNLLHRSGWLGAVDAWICVSEFMRDKFVEAGMPSDRVFALRHPWEPLTLPPLAEDAGYYLFLSRLVDVKGVEVMLRAWEKLAASLGSQAPELWIAGEGPMEAQVRAVAQRCPSIRFLGMISGDEKSKVLRRCRAVIIPSVWWEPLGIVTCEAYDHGKPVLAAASGGLIETVVAGVTGLVHSPGDDASLIRDVLAFEAMPAGKRSEMGQAARKWLVDHAGVEGWKRKFEMIAEAALQNHRARAR